MEERSTPAVPVPPSTQVTPAGAAGDDDPVESVPVREAPAEPEEFEKPEGHPPLWRNRDYMLLWSGQVVSAVGSGMSGLATPLLILALTNSPTAAGIAGALWSLPYLVFSLPVGAFIDRWDRKKVMILCDVGRALNIASVPIAFFFFELTIWQLYLNSLIEGTLFVFFNIAEVAALPRVVPRGQLPQATAQNEAGFIAASLVGPSLGGFLYKSISHMAPFIVDAVSYGASVLSLLLIRTRFQQERGAGQRHLLREVKEGLSWLWHQPLIRYMALLTGALNFTNAATGLIVIVLAKNLGASEDQIGLIMSVGSVGGILGSLVGGQIQKRFTFGQVIISAAWLWALLYPLYVVMPHFLLLGVVVALTWMLSPIYNVVQFSYRLALIPDTLQGRVNSTFRLLAFGFQPLGQALGGFLLERTGTTPTIMFYFGWLLLFAVLTTLNPHVRHARPIENLQDAVA